MQTILASDGVTGTMLVMQGARFQSSTCLGVPTVVCLTVFTPHIKQRSVKFPELFSEWRLKNTALTNEH